MGICACRDVVRPSDPHPQTLLAEWLPLYRTLRGSVPARHRGAHGPLAGGRAGVRAVRRCACRPAGAPRRSAGTLLALVVAGEMYREYRGPRLVGRRPLPREYPLLQPPAADDPLVRALAARIRGRCSRSR